VWQELPGERSVGACLGLACWACRSRVAQTIPHCQCGNFDGNTGRLRFAIGNRKSKIAEGFVNQKRHALKHIGGNETKRLDTLMKMENLPSF
jgi:hypothetical protein